MTTVTARLRALGLLTVTAAAATVGGALAPAGARAADNDICVGVVVDASALGDDIDTDCASVEDGSDGTDVLAAAGHELTVCRDGIVGEIDGRPADGCETKDSTHYWSYWHRDPGSSTWTYSTEGPATYEPPDKSTEGWVWQDGGSDNEPPPAIGYRRICPRTEPSESESPPNAGAHAPPHTAPPAPAPAPSATATDAITTPPPAPTPTPTRSGHTKRHAERSTSASAASTSASPRAAPTRVLESLPDDDNGGGGIPLGVVIGIVGVVALAGATVWQVRRQRDNP